MDVKGSGMTWPANVFEVTLTTNLIVVAIHEGIKRIRSLVPEETCRTITLQIL